MRTLFRTCFPIDLLMLTALAASAAPFVSTKGYSFTPAPGWRIKQGVMNSDMVAYTTPVDKFAPNLNVNVGPIKPGDKLEDGQKQIGAMYPKVFPDFYMISSKIDKWATPHTLDITARYRQGKRTLRMRQIILLRGDHVYTFTCTAPEASHARYDAAFTQMLHSVKWSK